VVVGIEKANQSPEDHVDGRRIQCRPQEDEQGLHDVRRQGPVWRLLGGYHTANVPDGLDWNANVSTSCLDSQLHADLHRHPMRKGRKYHVLLLINMYVWAAAGTAKRTTKTTFPAVLGLYR
jgi:hypothetical protein